MVRISVYSWTYDKFQFGPPIRKKLQFGPKNMINPRLVPSCNISIFRLVWWINEGYLVNYYEVLLFVLLWIRFQENR